MQIAVVAADDELVVFMLLHGYLLRRAGADLKSATQTKIKPCQPTPASRREAITGYTASEAYCWLFHRHTRACWQLQHGRALTFAQMRQQDDFSVGELKGIMMNV